MAWNDDLVVGTTTYNIASDDSPRIRVMCGPGTGKSFAMQRRVARMLESDVPPQRILPITFTRVAAEDLHRALVSLDTPGADELAGRTLHSLGMRILRRRNVLESTGRVPRPLNQYEAKALVCDLTNRFGSKNDRRKLIRAYEAAWARLQHDELGAMPPEGVVEFEGQLISWLLFHDAMLIGEIIPETYKYLNSNPGAPEFDLFDEILVDEYQDLNKVEQGVVDLLATNTGLCIVGDDDQSVYGFKHAHLQGIREFPDVHPGTSSHGLELCYRCPTRVVEMANSLIAHNGDREPRVLEARDENGLGVVDIRQFSTLEDESQGVADYISEILAQPSIELGDILVLAQRRVIGNPIMEIVRRRGISIRSYYQESELERSESQERLTMLKLLVDRYDRVALRWLLGMNHQDFRASQYSRVRQFCEERGQSPWQAMVDLLEGRITMPYTNTLQDRFRGIKEELKRLQDIPADEFIPTWLPIELENVNELRELSITMGNIEEGLEKFLNNLESAITQPEVPVEVDYIRVMSLHKSKGLSSPVVIVAGCVNGLLPGIPDADVRGPNRIAFYEEQRRLFYVGITRTKAQPNFGKPGNLLLTSFQRMSLADAMGASIRPAGTRYGLAFVVASQFLNELGPSAPPSRVG